MFCNAVLTCNTVHKHCCLVGTMTIVQIRRGGYSVSSRITCRTNWTPRFFGGLLPILFLWWQVDDNRCTVWYRESFPPHIDYSPPIPPPQLYLLLKVPMKIDRVKVTNSDYKTCIWKLRFLWWWWKLGHWRCSYFERLFTSLHSVLE